MLESLPAQSITSAMNRSVSVRHPKPKIMASTSPRVLVPTSTTRPCTSCISGKGGFQSSETFTHPTRPFADAVRAGTGSIMCSYEQINNSYGCQNSYSLNYLLKNELDFQGFVMSDWQAQHSGVGNILAGLDMVSPLLLPSHYIR